jgi:hypothetical protein
VEHTGEGRPTPKAWDAPDAASLKLTAEILDFVKSREDDDSVIMAALQAARAVFSRRWRFD